MTGRAHYESINSLCMFSESTLNIVPKYNMISNVGVGCETTHGGDDIRKYPKKIRNLLYKTTYEIEFPLKHPKYVMRNRDFEQKMTLSHIERILCKVESIFLRLKYGGISELRKILK